MTNIIVDNGGPRLNLGPENYWGDHWTLSGKETGGEEGPGNECVGDID